MRKRWVWMGVAATAMTLAVFALIPRDDGLDFIRKYRPKSEKLLTSIWTLGGKSRPISWRREFVFEAIPPKLVQEINKRYRAWPPLRDPILIWEDYPRYGIAMSIREKVLTVFSVEEPPWVIGQWATAKRKLGWDAYEWDGPFEEYGMDHFRLLYD